MKTRIIVDSTADLMPEYKSRVSVVPLTVHFGEEEYIDGVTIDHKTFYDDVIDGAYFWQYAKRSPFYQLIFIRKMNFSEKDRDAHDAMAKDILLHAEKIVASDTTFSKIIGARG